MIFQALISRKQIREVHFVLDRKDGISIIPLFPPFTIDYDDDDNNNKNNNRNKKHMHVIIIDLN